MTIPTLQDRKNRAIIEEFLGVCVHSSQQQTFLYNKAVKEESFKSLIPYPCLLVVWQNTHKEDAKKIATISSHRNANHVWCTTKEECDNIDQFIKEQMLIQQELEYDTTTVSTEVSQGNVA